LGIGLNKNGYTLIELAVVVFLLGLMVYISVPRIRDTLIKDEVKSTVRRLIGVVRELRAAAVREQVDYVLHLDLYKNAFWTYSVDMTPEKRDERKINAFNFPEGVKIADVSQLGLEKKADGEVDIKFFKQGYGQPTIIHLARADQYFTIVLSPFLNNINVYDKYVDVTPEGVEKD
jgi:general secretion pathway protein H